MRLIAKLLYINKKKYGRRKKKILDVKTKFCVAWNLGKKNTLSIDKGSNTPKGKGKQTNKKD